MARYKLVQFHRCAYEVRMKFCDMANGSLAPCYGVAVAKIHHVNSGRSLAAQVRLSPGSSFVRTPSPVLVDPPRHQALFPEAHVGDGAPLDSGRALGTGDLLGWPPEGGWLPSPVPVSRQTPRFGPRPSAALSRPPTVSSPARFRVALPEPAGHGPRLQSRHKLRFS